MISMFRPPCFLALSALLAGLVFANHPENGVDKYRTRPDIVSPQWNVTIYDESELAPGYWFMTPYEKIGERKSGGAWVGPHIYDQWGGLIWSGSYLFNDINIMDFKLSNVKGKDSLTMMYPVEGLGYIFDSHYELVEKVPVGITGDTLNMHEFNFVEEGKTLLLLKRNTTYAPREMSENTGFDGECHVTFEGFEEVSTENWETKFSWKTYGNIGLDESTMDLATPKDRCTGGAWDYLHTNALDKFTDGHYLLSARHADTLYKISKDDGSIIWRLGGHYSDFEIGDWNFTRQHHARFLSQNDTHTYLSVFDNAKGADRQPPSSLNSRGLIIVLRTDTDPKTAELVAHYDHPYGLGHYAYRRGNFQILKNKNAFLCWSEQSLQSEHMKDGTLIMEARMVPNWIGTYRGFKYEFVGLPKQPPDVLSETESKGPVHNFTKTRVHVSWNGATEVKTWMFYKSTKDGKTQTRIGSEPRSGFETSFEWEGYASYVVVEAMDKTGNSLGSSKVIKTEEPANLDADDVRVELQWQIDAGLGLIHPGDPVNLRPEMFFEKPAQTLMAFIAGLLFTPLLLFIIHRLRRRRIKSSWMRSQGHARDHDETTLKDLSSESHHMGSLSDHFDVNDDEDEDQSDTDRGRLNARIPYARQISDMYIPSRLS